MIDLRTLLVAMLACLAFGGWTGWYTKGQFVKAAETDNLRGVLKQSNVNVVESAVANTALVTAIDADATHIDTIAKDVRARVILNTPERPHDPSQRPNPATAATGCTETINPADDRVLDLGTVRLLNAARSGADLEPAPGQPDQE